MVAGSLRIASVSDSPVLLRIPAEDSAGLTVFLLAMHQSNASLRVKVLDLTSMKLGGPSAHPLGKLHLKKGEEVDIE